MSPLLIKKITTALILIYLSPYCFANSVSINKIITSIDQHPKVVNMARKLSSQLIKTNIARSEGPQINFSTKGNIPIARNINKNLYRSPIDKRAYIDAIVTGSMILYDFGELDANIAANIALESSSKLEYEDVREAILLELLQSIVEFYRLEASRVVIEESITNINLILIKAKQLYKSGVGTIIDVREVELSRLDIESELQLLILEQEKILKKLRYEFGFSTSNFDGIYDISYLLSSVISDNKILKSVRLNAIYQFKVDSVKKKIFAINASRMPNVKGVVTTSFYDVLRGLNEYQINGSLNIALPLFDSGRGDVQLQNAMNNISIEDDKFRALLFDKELALEDLNSHTDGLKSINILNLIKRLELNKKNANLELKQKNTNGYLLPKMKLQIEIDLLKRELLNYDYIIMQSNLRYLRLNEILLYEFSKLN